MINRQRPPSASTKPSFRRPLAHLRLAILQSASGDKSTREDVVELIDAALQRDDGDALKAQENALNQGIEVLKGILESVKDKELFEELYKINKLLEMSYINSTDIEYAMFYNKEVTMIVDRLVNDLRMQDGFELDKKRLDADVERGFLEMENRKQNYFELNNKEMSERTENRRAKDNALNQYLQEVH